MFYKVYQYKYIIYKKVYKKILISRLWKTRQGFNVLLFFKLFLRKKIVKWRENENR